MSVVHDAAKIGFGTGTNELYDQARPSYKPFVLSHIRNAVKSTEPLNIVELGAGTGIFTRALLADPEWASSVKELKAIEPSEGMREVFTKTVTDERASANEGTFAATGVASGWADIIIIAQAFHWCHPDYDSAIVEFARVLKPDGVVAFVWNLEDREGARWVAQLRERYEKYEHGSPQFRLGLWREAFNTPSYKKLFQPQEEKEWAYANIGTLDIVVDRACTKSYIAVLPQDEKDQVRADVKAIVEKGDDKVWIDESKGIFEYPYKTLVVISKRQ